MAITISGSNDNISASDGSLTIQGLTASGAGALDVTGFSTFSNGIQVGTASTIIGFGRTTFIGHESQRFTRYNDTSATTLELVDTGNNVQLQLRGTSPILFFDPTSGGDGRIFIDSSDFKFNTGRPSSFDAANDKVTINSSGLVGIGTDDPQDDLHVVGEVRISDTSDVSQRLRITYEGIDFQNTGAGSSTAATSHLLDDYEEGTWDPVLFFGGTACTMNTSSNQKGTYVRVGGTVHCSFNMTHSSKNSGTGNASMQGFPFNSLNVGNFAFYNGNIQPDSGMDTLPSGAGSVMIYLSDGGSSARLLYMTNTAHADVTGSMVADGTSYYGQITYRIA